MSDYIEILTNHKQHDPKAVCAAIDEIVAESEFMTDEQRREAHDLLVSIKWSWHYPNVITDVRQSCWDNPGWYSDVVLYYGWDEALKMKGVRQ